MNKLAIKPFIFVLALLCGCSMLPLTGGGSSQQGNGIVTGRVVDVTGEPAPCAQVRLLPADYDPVKDPMVPDSLMAITDDNGGYTLRPSQKGKYTIEVVLAATKGTTLVTGISITAADTILAPLATLRQPGYIKLDLPNLVDTASAYAYVPGTTSFEYVNGRSTLIIAVPSGIIPGLYFTARNVVTMPRSIQNTIVITSGDTTQIADYHAWKHSAKLYLNTTGGGAGVSGTVTGFPVLVRLTKNNFNFADAKGDGSDIRFEKANGMPLPCEIERWDAAGRQAELWVKVDSVFGNDSTHCIAMYWGNSLVSNGPAGGKVFTYANGYAGVWHLGPDLNDATLGVGSGIDSATADTVGIIGRCRRFDPARHSFVTIPSSTKFDLTTSMTLSAWALVDTFSRQWQTIVAKGDHTYRLHRDGLTNYAGFSFTTDTVNFSYKTLGGTTRINDKSWHLICGVFNGSVMRLYVDGVLESDSTVNQPCLKSSDNLTIGNNQGQTLRYFGGAIDEVRVMNKALGADWVKLCYMNQKAIDRLILFR
jgi:hypothetical protein